MKEETLSAHQATTSSTIFRLAPHRRSAVGRKLHRQRSTELTEKDISARAIQHGCEDSVLNLKRWAGPVTSKPGLKELRAEVIRRDPTARPSWWVVDKLVAWLMQPGHKPPADPDPSDALRLRRLLLPQLPAPQPTKHLATRATRGVRRM